MQYNPIKNYHMENVVLGKDFNLGTTSSFFHVFTFVPPIVQQFQNNMLAFFLERGHDLSN